MLSEMPRVDTAQYYIITYQCIIETITHLLMFSLTRGRVGEHEHLTQILSRWRRFSFN